MRLSFIILVSLILLGCEHDQPNLNKVLLLGHGGIGFDNLNGQYAPNSVPSMEISLDFYHLDGVEVDVQFTKDGELIVFHDDYLENATQCKGRISSLNLADIGTCLYRKQFSNIYNHGIITLDSLITLINERWNRKYFSFHVKDNFDVPFKIDSLAGRLHQKLRRLYAIDRVFVECRDANLLYGLKQRNNYQCLLVSALDSTGARDVDRFGLEGIVTRFDKIDRESHHKMSKNSKRVVLHGQQKSRHFTQIDYSGIDAVQVDNPVLALRYFREN